MSLLEQILKDKSSFSGRELLALQKVEALGFPTRQDEEYKYTNLQEVVGKAYNFAPNAEHRLTKKEVESLSLDKGNFDRVVFVNGVFSEELSQISQGNAVLMPLEVAVNHSDCKQIIDKHFNTIANQELVFPNLNLAYAKNGFFLHITKNKQVERPIHIFYLSDNQKENTLYNIRNLLIAEEGSKVEVIETHHNFDESFTLTNAVTEIFVEANADANWHKLQNDSHQSYLVDSTFVKQDRDSLATVNTFSFGGKLVRNNLDFIHNGENIHSFMNGITLIGAGQLVDHHTAVHHNTPNCESYQNYKGIFKDDARGVFNGKVFVNKIAQKTNAYQQNNNILLSEGASIDTKPQLEIFADDVKCSHGCTVGQLNEEALFYLRARGITKNAAEALLLYAFANDAMENINIEALQNKVSQLLAQKLNVDF